jgi:hypothetical protein
VAAARHEVRKADFVDLAEVRVLDPVADRDDAGDVELDPAQVGNRYVGPG